MREDISWDAYYLKICDAVGLKSRCLSRHVGAIIVRDKKVIGTGYNGPPKGVPHCESRWRSDNALREEAVKQCIASSESEFDEFGTKMLCPRSILGYNSGQGLEWCIAAHAERNCLINASREGVDPRGTTLYLNTCLPCKDCLIEIIQYGVVEVVAKELVYYDKMSEWLVYFSGLKVRGFSINGR